MCPSFKAICERVVELRPIVDPVHWIPKFINAILLNLIVFREPSVNNQVNKSAGKSPHQKFDS